MKEQTKPTICVLIPCLNEQKEIGSVVRSFRDLWPDCEILAVDNYSTGPVVEEARKAGAKVLVERRRGKAAAVISALPLIDTDVLVLTTGDGRYPVEGAARLLEFYQWEHPDMVTGTRRLADAESRPDLETTFRTRSKPYRFMLNLLLGRPPEDLTCELRLFSRFFYKNIPIQLRGFDLETELAVQALDKQFRLADVPVPYIPRADATEYKPSRTRNILTFLRFCFTLLRDQKPMVLFGAVSLLFLVAGLAVGSVPIYEFATTGIIRRLLLPVLAASLVIIAFFTFQFGMVLEASMRYRRETYQTQLRRFFNSPHSTGSDFA